MATLKGITPNQIYPQPGFSPAMTQNGGWEGSHTFKLSRDSLNNSAVRNRFRKGAIITQLDPSLPSFFSFMTLDRAQIVMGEGDIVDIVATFAGAEGATYGGGGGGSAQQATYELNGTLNEAPLSEHPKWKELEDNEREPLQRMLAGELSIKSTGAETFEFGYWEGNSWWPISEYEDLAVDDVLSFAKLIASGKTSYLRPVEIWTERAEGNTPMTNDQLNDLGKIATPAGEPPNVSEGRNWMLTAASQVESGSKYTLFREWTLSEREGHDAFLYD